MDAIFEKENYKLNLFLSLIFPIALHGFYNYLITIVVFIITLLGVLNLTEELLVQYYPDLEIHINYLFETINNITTIIQDMLYHSNRKSGVRLKAASNRGGHIDLLIIS